MASVFEKQYENTTDLKAILDKHKGMVCKEFEKICPSEASFRRCVKDMHNIFDSMYEQIEPLLKK